MRKLHLTHADILLPCDTLRDASLVIEDGCIAAVDPETVTDAIEVDLGGNALSPGLIDLHCDLIEKCIEPRAGVFYPIDFAIPQADRIYAAAGVTTAYHAVSFGDDELGIRNTAMASELCSALSGYNSGETLVDNRVHVRYEITDAQSVERILELVADGHVDLLSFMDHTPGQGQFKDEAAFRHYYTNNHGRSEAEVNELLQRKLMAAKGTNERICALIETARWHNVQLAAHDVDSPEGVDAMCELGVSIAEFPINLAAAARAVELEMDTIFGAPNILRGGSQSGSVRAMDAVEVGLATSLCSDYTPATLLPAVFRIVREQHIKLHDAIRIVTANPAHAVGLDDRGRITEGARADLIAFRPVQDQPMVTHVWRAGTQVYQITPFPDPKERNVAWTRQSNHAETVRSEEPALST